MVSIEKSSEAEAPVVHTLLLHPDDTVLVCIRAISPGNVVAIDQLVVNAPAAVQVGHKVARQAFKPGDKVFKYGVPIGSVTQAVQPGEHVHSHNMKSDYIPSHSRNHSHQSGQDKATDERKSQP